MYGPIRAAAAASLIASVSGHAIWQDLWIGDVDAGTSCARVPSSNSPVTDVTGSAIACNTGTAKASGICPVEAGSQVTVEMHQQMNDRSCENEAIGGQHYGPVIIYLAKVDDAASAEGTDAAWFKVDSAGLVSNSPDYFANQVLNDNCGHWTFTVPADIAPGDYLLRAETIALHSASGAGGAQFYMTCYQLTVTGGGSASPDTVSFPGAYDASDPGILVDIHQTLSTYVVPGPTPYGTAEWPVATTAYPTTATWDIASAPTSVPTAVPSV
ncbi:lytic polysaccharide monooxygenase [Cylindrobasidium torrendii FP15055 ss-10]|uniref:AA9 family lytic polysaccharide monooxygenase n=1 Tax=Cylindrobasidium torrendii FP15055 ss-10 TaxID=1314674 RepID=A0A0D7BSR7_9AGAR|nr:lytic polysaccharide monooxygenase [Cylindrobasidium torrendii FP15055 ss-10]